VVTTIGRLVVATGFEPSNLGGSVGTVLKVTTVVASVGPGLAVVVLLKNSDPNFLGAFLSDFLRCWFFLANKRLDLTLGILPSAPGLTKALNLLLEVVGASVVVVVLVVELKSPRATEDWDTGLKVDTWTGSRTESVGAATVGLNEDSNC